MKAQLASTPGRTSMTKESATRNYERVKKERNRLTRENTYSDRDFHENELKKIVEES